MSSLGQFFTGGISNKIEALYDDAKNTGILDPVGTSAYSVQDLAVSASDSSLKVFDLTADLGADSSAQATINAASAEIAPFDSSSGITAPSGTSYAQLNVDGKLTAGLDGTIKSSPLTLSAGATASFVYNHYLLVAETDRRIDALEKVVASAQLPQFESLATMKPGEISSFEGTLSFDLGLSAKYGTSYDMSHTLQLFDGLSAQLTASVQQSISASLGWSLYDDMTMVVATAQQNNPNWVRIRIDRTHKNSFTAGATFALQVDYDASSIATALEKAFDLTPLPRAIAVLTTVSQGNWSEVTAKIVDRASDELISLIAGTGWKQKAADSPDVTKALAAINKTISIYNSVDTKVQQLWNDLLTRVDLQPGSPVRNAIDTIAALDPSNPNLQQFLPSSAQKDLDMLESLTGTSIEQLLVGSNAAVQTAITKAVSLAKQLERVITDTPSEVESALTTFTKNTGIQTAITWLSTNATSLDAIQNWGDDEIKKIVTKAVGKAFDKISADDLKKVQTWATKILAEWDDLSKKLTAAAKYLKGTLGFNVSLEFSRTSESSALIDFEVDPTNAAAVSAVSKKLPGGSVLDMLSALNDLDPAAYSIRESILVSQHLRTGVTSVLLSIFNLQNLQQVTGTRIQESSVNISNSGRTATYSGGFVQAVTASKATSECGAWVVADASDDQKDMKQPYGTVSRSMRLTFARSDPSTGAAELGALQTLLVDLGFFANGGTTLSAPTGAETSFTMDIELDETAVARFATDDGEANWNKDYRNAAYRLLRDDMVTDQLATIAQPIGEVLATVVKSDIFGDTWTDTSENGFKARYAQEKLQISGKTLLILDSVSKQFIPPYIPIKMAIDRRPRGFGPLASLRSGLAASAQKTDKALNQLSAGAAATFANTAFPEWSNPMFNFWFVVARLCRLGADVLQNAAGYATFRYRTSSTAAMSDPAQWTLTRSVGVPATAIKVRQLFPFA